MVLRKSKVIPIIVIAIIAAILYRLHTIEKPQIVFSDDGLITGDGYAPYEHGVQGVVAEMPVTAIASGFSLSLIESPRFVVVKFQEAYWKDEHLRSIPPELPSKNYRVILGVVIPNGGIDRMAVGEVLEIPNAVVTIGFIDADTGVFTGYALRTMPTLPEPGLSGFSAGNYAFWINVTAPEPHQALYNEGHVTLWRTGEKTWTLDVDVWLALFQPKTEEELVKYYIRLSFRMTTTVKSLI